MFFGIKDKAVEAPAPVETLPDPVVNSPVEVEPVIVPAEPPIAIEPIKPEPMPVDEPDTPVEVIPEPIIEVEPVPTPIKDPKPEPVIEVQPQPAPVEQPKPEPVIIPLPKPEPLPPAAAKELKDLLPFTLGVAVQLDQMKQKDYVTNVRKYFKRVTFVNDLKMKSVQNSKGEFNFKEIDKAVDQYLAWGIPVHGHTLVYDAVVNDYFRLFKGTDKEFEAELKRYVQTVVGHFKGRVATWDVLNEPWDVTGNIQQKVYVKRMGIDYMKKVFTWAHEADPFSLKLLNDYNLQYTGKKTNALVKWLKECKAEGIPVHGVGNQMHTNTSLNLTEFKAAVKMVTDLGLMYHVSELEVKVSNPVPTPAQREAQTKTYLGIFNVVRGIPEAQNMGITLWGLSKPYWFDNAKAGKGKHIDDPLLLSDNYDPSPAYTSLVASYLIA
jgi:endo-1,4-beta-xylanase